MGTLQSGTVLHDRYRIVRVISSGGMGVVYEALDMQAGDEPCAVKQLMELDVDDASRRILRRKFDDEMRFLSALSHPGIPRFRNHFSADDGQFIVMELIDGEPLDLELDSAQKHRRGMPADQVADDALAVLDILVYLHGRVPPVLHRDIKPANIVRERASGRIKLLDFGIARSHSGRATTHTQLGTLSYAPLEQIQGHAEPRSDIYALGVTMHHLIGGVESPPLAVPPLQRVAPEVDAELAAIVNRAVAPAAIDRFEDAEAMRVALADWRRRALHDPGGATQPMLVPGGGEARQTVSLPAPDATPRRLVVGATAVGALTLGLALYALQPRPASVAPGTTGAAPVIRAQAAHEVAVPASSDRISPQASPNAPAPVATPLAPTPSAAHSKGASPSPVTRPKATPSRRVIVDVPVAPIRPSEAQPVATATTKAPAVEPRSTPAPRPSEAAQASPATGTSRIDAQEGPPRPRDGLGPPPRRPGEEPPPWPPGPPDGRDPAGLGPPPRREGSGPPPRPDDALHGSGTYPGQGPPPPPRP